MTLVIPLPGVKLGLANIVTVFALYQLGPLPALCILAARCLLGSLFAGNASALLFSLLGGTLAMLVMLALSRLPVCRYTACPSAARRATTSARWRRP